MFEIEKKFLPKDTTFIPKSDKYYKIQQGYLNSNPERTVRVRIKNNKGYITVKGKSNNSGMSRFEWEKEIPVNEAINLLNLCEDYVIEKTRYEVIFNGKTFEIDVFEGHHKGLIIIEVELSSEDEYFDKPNWLGVEVTGQEKYYNSYISQHKIL